MAPPPAAPTTPPMRAPVPRCPLPAISAPAPAPTAAPPRAPIAVRLYSFVPSGFVAHPVESTNSADIIKAATFTGILVFIPPPRIPLFRKLHIRLRVEDSEIFLLLRDSARAGNPVFRLPRATGRRFLHEPCHDNRCWRGWRGNPWGFEFPLGTIAIPKVSLIGRPGNYSTRRILSRSFPVYANKNRNPTEGGDR